MALLLEFPKDIAHRQLDLAINWGRYAELIDYNHNTEIISLDASEGKVSTP